MAEHVLAKGRAKAKGKDKAKSPDGADPNKQVSARKKQPRKRLLISMWLCVVLYTPFSIGVIMINLLKAPFSIM